MQKITFENLPSTNTPLNASNLNTLQDNVENAFNNTYGTSQTEGYSQEYINSLPNAITVRLSDNQSAAISSSYTRVKIAFNRLVAQAGDKLTFDSTNNCIVIGAGVNHIEVSANAVISNGSNSISDRYVYIVKDKTPIENIGQAYYLNGIASNQHYPVNVTPIIYEVSENDKIIAQVSSGLAETLSIKGASQPRTYLTVKVID